VPLIQYCQGQTAEPMDTFIIAEPNHTLEFYLNGNYIPGIPTPDTSTVGTLTYYVIQMSDVGCQSLEVVVPVEILPLQDPVVDFTFPAEVCTAQGTITPVLDPNFSLGGIFSADPGLTIDPDTG